MARANIDITGAGPHMLINPAADEHVLVHNLLLTFSHASTTSLRIWFWAGANLEAGPFYVTDGGEVRYKDTEAVKRYIGAAGVPLMATMDPGLSAAGIIDYELGAF